MNRISTLHQSQHKQCSKILDVLHRTLLVRYHKKDRTRLKNTPILMHCSYYPVWQDICYTEMEVIITLYYI